MEREQKPRRGAASVSAPGKKAAPRPRRSAGSRVGLRKPGAPAPQPAPRQASPHTPAPPQNPRRRVTGAERLRQRRRRALVGALLVLAVLALGVWLTVHLLFKVQEFRIEAMDGTTPADTGIYTEEQILDVLGVQIGDSLFGFSAAEKTAQLAERLPYLETVQVKTTLPGTVLIRMQPAVERFALPVMNGYLILSGGLKVLRTSDAAPQGTALLEAALPQGGDPLPGQTLALQSYNSLLDADADPSATAPPADSGEASATLAEMMAGLEREGLLDGLTALSVADLSELSFTYEGRVRVLLGTDSRLADKLHIAAAALLPSYEQSLGATDRGTLEFYQNTGSELRATFTPGDPDAAPVPKDGETDPDAEEPAVG